MSQSRVAALVIAGVLTVASAPLRAAPVTFFGEDLNTGTANGTGHSGDPGYLTSFPNSNAAQQDLFNNLSGVGTETFDTLSPGTTDPTIAFSVPSGTVDATLTGGTVTAGYTGGGRYPISNPNYLAAGTASFDVTFSAAISAFGFYGTDIGDFGGALKLQLTDKNGIVTDLSVNNLLGTCTGTPCSDPTSGSVLYFGFYDTSDTYTSIAFINNSTVDSFGFDNFSVGTLQQVTPMPEPGTLVSLAVGVVGLGIGRRLFLRT